MEPYRLSVSEAAEAIKRGDVSPVELIDSVLDRIDSVEPEIRAFATVTADLARSAARAAEKEIGSGSRRGPLHGIPIGIKDVIETAGIPTSAGSAVRRQHLPTSDAFVVQRLRASGAVVIGKTHTHEFAMGGITPTTRNPWNAKCIPGGSSGGSAAAVAAGECPAALGTDTVGSVRIPAALCGTVGFKPTYGRVSRRGILPVSWSLDHVGVLTASVCDAAVVLQAIAGHDQLDACAVRIPTADYSNGLDAGVEGLRIGIPTGFFFQRVADDVTRPVTAALSVLQSAGAKLRDVCVPLSEYLEATAHTILLPEAAAYHRELFQQQGHMYSDDVRARLQAGRMVPATDYSDALRTRALVRSRWAGMFGDIDVLASPAVPVTAPRVGQTTCDWSDGTSEPVGRSLARLALAANIAGLPALSVPCGLSSQGMPVGIQIIGRPFEEVTVLRVGRAYEQAVGWRRRIPAVTEFS